MRNVILILWILFFLTACKDYLDMVPENDIESVESIFEKRSGADKWITSIHMYLVYGDWGSITNAGVTGADEFVGGDYVRSSSNIYYLPALKIADGLQMSLDPYCNLWKEDLMVYNRGVYYYIRMCNTFLENIDRVYNMEKSEKAQWTAEVKAIKAYFYFELVRRYGPIVLVPNNIGVEASIEEIQHPRSHVDTCFKEIVNLLDEAIAYLPTNTERNPIRRAYFCRESAMALKARALLYAASPLFNGNEFYANFKNRDGELLFSTTRDPEKWRLAAEAADKAVEECERLGRKLIDGHIDRSTKLQNTMDDIEYSVLPVGFESTECLFSIKVYDYYRWTLPRFKAGEADRDDQLQGCLGASMKMVEMFYTENGLPIENDKTWNYEGRYQMSKETSSAYQDVVPLNEDVLSLHLRREPRFYADIAADRCYWRRGKKSDMEDYKVKAYQGERWGLEASRIISTTPQNISGYWVKKMTISSVETKDYDMNIRSLGDIPYPVLRLAELYLIQAEAWNEYLEVPDNRVYAPLNKVRKRAGIPDVEISWGTYSNTPDKVRKKEGMREIIQREVNIEFAFEGHRFWNLRRWKKAHTELNDKIKGWNVTADNAQGFYNNWEGPIVVWNQTKFLSPRDYLFPIKSEEVLISGCMQNPDW